jgi:hypothetical protein
MVEFIDPSWGQKAADKLKLSILLEPDSFSFSVLHHQKVLVFKQYQRNITEDFSPSNLTEFADRIKDDAIMKLTFASRSFQIIPDLFAFLPIRLFDKNNADAYWAHLTDAAFDTPARFVEMPEQDLVILYRENFFQQHLSQLLFPDLSSFPIFKTLLPFLLEQDIPDMHIFCRISKNYLLVFTYRDRIFQFSNQFHCKETTDFQYFILLTCNQFQLIPSHETLYLWGDCEEESEVVLRLKALFYGIKFLRAHWVIAPEAKTRVLSESKVLEHLIS